MKLSTNNKIKNIYTWHQSAISIGIQKLLFVLENLSE